MNDIDNTISDKKIRLIIRFSRDNMALSVGDPKENGILAYEVYDLKNGISVAANLREAFNHSELLQSGYRKVMVELDTPVMLIPNDDYSDADKEILYQHTFRTKGNEDIISTELLTLNTRAVFAINKDLRLVIDDHFEDVLFQPLMASVWIHLYRHSFGGPRRKLFAYFHDKQMEVFSFQQNRFRFSNFYAVSNQNDALYFLLYVWKTLGMDNQQDQLLILGNIPYASWLTENINKHLRHCNLLSQEEDFNHSALSSRADIPYDVKAIYLD